MRLLLRLVHGLLLLDRLLRRLLLSRAALHLWLAGVSADIRIICRIVFPLLWLVVLLLRCGVVLIVFPLLFWPCIPARGSIMPNSEVGYLTWLLLRLYINLGRHCRRRRRRCCC